MDDIFLTVLSLSVSGGILALVLLLLKKFAFSLLSKSWQYYIWALLIVRLIVPFSPETSLMNQVFENVSTVPAKIEATFPDIGQDFNIVSNDDFIFPEIGNDLPAAGERETISEKTSIIKDIWHYCEIGVRYLWIVWLSVALILFGKRLFIYFRILFNVKRNRQLITDETVLTLYREICKSQKLKRPPPLYSYSYPFSPMTVGFFRQFIILPDTILKNTKSLKLVLQHELTHYRRGDVYYKWLMQTTLCLHWFNPLIHFAAKSMDEACELSCDDWVLRHLDQDEKQEYGLTLISYLKPGHSSKNSTVELALCKDAKEVKNRLVAILHYQPNTGKMAAVGMVLTIFLAAGAGYLGAYTLKPAVKDNTLLTGNGMGFIYENPAVVEVSQSADSMNLIRDNVFQANEVDSLFFNLKYCDTYFYYNDRDEFRIKQFADPSIPVSAQIPCYQEGNAIITMAGQRYSYDANEIPKETLISGPNPDSRIRIEVYVPASFEGNLTLKLDSSYLNVLIPLSLSKLNLSFNSSTCLIPDLYAEECYIDDTAGDYSQTDGRAFAGSCGFPGEITIGQFRLNGDFQISTECGNIKIGMSKEQRYLVSGVAQNLLHILES